MTLIETIDAARGLLNEPLDSSRTYPDNTSSFWTDSILTTYFNIIQQEVQQEIIQTFEDYFLTSTDLAIVNGTSDYTLPTGFIKARRLEDRRVTTAPVEILPCTINDRSGGGGGKFTIASATVFAGGYYIRGNQIVLTDTPTYTNSAAIRLYYIKSLADVTAASLTSEIPIEHHRVLVWGIVKYALFQQQSDNTLANAEYDKHMSNIKKQAENRQIQRPRRVMARGSSQNWGTF